MNSKPPRERLLDALFVLSVICLVALVTLILWDRVTRSTAFTRADRVVDSWEQYSAGVGHRVGPMRASVTIVVFSDYQCAACRAFEPRLKMVRDRYPNDVAVVYRHWPLPNHAAAYVAARAAECAAQQGRFAAFHEFLYARPDWMVDSREIFLLAAEQMEMPN